MTRFRGIAKRSTGTTINPLRDPHLLYKGLLTRLVGALTWRLFNDPTFTQIEADPATTNARVLHCYEKAGFERVKVIVTPDGQATYMLKARPVIARL